MHSQINVLFIEDSEDGAELILREIHDEIGISLNSSELEYDF